MNSDPLTDARGLAVSTTSFVSATQYSRGVDLLLVSSPEAVPVLRDAVEADPGFELARVALACAIVNADEQAEFAQCEGSLCQPACAPTRRERQHIEVLELILSGERDRAAVLGREHVREFPGDILVSHMLASHGLG